jgi:glycosyltransferase involved in cell wall biosynthesis
VLVLHQYLADHYRERYGIECVVLRQIVRHSAMPAREPDRNRRDRIIGFSGAIYGNNRQQLTDLAKVVARDPRLRLRVWSDASTEQLQRCGITGDRVDVQYEANYERLLAQLGECDLLYLPLAFHDSSSVTTESLQYAFPTKSLDYLVCGVPILVHCPSNYELSRFFTEQKCAHVVNDNEPEAIANWLNRWLDGVVAPLDDCNRRNALSIFSPEENKRLLWEAIADCRRHRGRSTRDPISERA